MAYPINIIHSDCDDMYDVARYYIEETGALGEVPASLQNYIDYQAYGRDLDLSGTFISTNHGHFSTESSIRSAQERSKNEVTGKLKAVAYDKIDQQTDA
ncbi:hypothetical protein EfmJHP38_28330 [Enterococcus faecium]|nr:hypothetical protein EfmJHP38_28330 [Enterococcus faecium]